MFLFFMWLSGVHKTICFLSTKSAFIHICVFRASHGLTEHTVLTCAVLDETVVALLTSHVTLNYLFTFIFLKILLQ